MSTKTELFVLWAWPVALIGAALIVRGMRGRRVGGTRYCSQCAYNLTGIASSRCPECGNSVTSVGSRVGQRRIRYVALGLGVLCVLFFLMPWYTSWYTRLRKWIAFDYYSVYPTSLLIDAIGNDPNRVYVEIARRLARDDLSTRQYHEIAEAAFRYNTPVIMDSPWGRLLSELYNHNRLTNEQSDRFCLRLVPVELSWHEASESHGGFTCAVSAGETAPIALGHVYTAHLSQVRVGKLLPSGVEWFARIPVSGRVYLLREDVNGQICGRNGVSLEICLPTEVTPGILCIELLGEQRIWLDAGDGNLGALIWSERFSLSADVRVLPDGTFDLSDVLEAEEMRTGLFAD